MRRTGLALLALTTALCLLPLVSVVVAGTTASLLGCDLDEGSVHPCLAFGTDIGETLYVMAVAGWFMLMTLPVLALALLVWLGLGVAALVRRLTRRG